MVFAGEAYNVEQGVSNEAFTNERAAVTGCIYNGTPEDATKLLNDSGGSTVRNKNGDARRTPVSVAPFNKASRRSTTTTTSGSSGIG